MLCSLLAREQCAIFDLARIGSSLWPSCFCAFLSVFSSFDSEMSRRVRSIASKRVTYAVSNVPFSSTPPPRLPCCLALRFTVLHSIAYEINRICRCLVLTGSNTIDKDYVCLYTPERVCPVCVCVCSIVCVHRILSAAAWETSTLIGQLSV